MGDGSRFGLEIRYVHQDPPNGTGGAVLSASSQIGSDPFGVLYADIFFQPMEDTWRSILQSSDATILCARVPDTSQFGRIEYRGDLSTGFLGRIVEKDGKKRPGLVNAGVMLLPRSVLETLQCQGRSPRGEIELTTAVESLAILGRDVRIQEVGRWTDIGTLSALHLAESMPGADSYS